MRALRWRKRESKKRRRKKEGEKKESSLEVWNISFVWNSCLELLDLLVRKPP